MANNIEHKKVSRLGYFVANHPWWTLLLSLLWLLPLISGVTKIGFDNDYRVYFSKENPQLMTFEAFQNTFSKSDNVMLVVAPTSGNVFTPAVLQALDHLTTEGWQVPHARRVDSIINFQHTTANQDDLTVRDLVSNVTDLKEQDLAEIRRIALAEPFLVNRLVSAKGHAAAVNITVELPQKSPSEAKAIAQKARELIVAVEAKYPVKVYLTGMVMMNNAFSEQSEIDNQTLLPIMLGIVLLVLWFSLRSVTATFSVIVLILLSILGALGATGWLGWKLNPTSVTSPIIILTMAVADCVHVLVTLLHKMRQGLDKKQAIQESLRINFQPVFITSLTTALGFLSLNFSDSPPFRELGCIVAIGVGIAFILSVTLLLALVAIFPLKVKERKDLGDFFMPRLSGFVIKYRKVLLVVNGLIAIALISLAPRNQLNDEFVKYFDNTVEFRVSSDYYSDNVGGLYNIEYSVFAGESGAINDPEFLRKLKKFSEWLMSLPDVKHVNTLTDTFKRLNKNMHGDDEDWYKLPEQRDLAAQYLLLYEMSLPYGLDLNDQINVDKSAVRLTVSTRSMSSNEFLGLEQKVNEWLQANLPGIKVAAASPTLMFSHIGKRNIGSMVFGTLIALVMISVVLMLAFGSVKLGLISLIPNLVPAGIAFGIWYLIDGWIGLALSVVTGLTLGIVVDDTVHFISKYQRARVEQGLGSQQAVRYAFSTVGVALWVTSLVLISGFLVLANSHFVLNSGMGMMTAITIAIALWMDFTFLPPILMSLSRK
ncbi:MAG: efflux RND transporter permease subunit [Methylococcaceae bacterium]